MVFCLVFHVIDLVHIVHMAGAKYRVLSAARPFGNAHFLGLLREVFSNLMPSTAPSNGPITWSGRGHVRLR